MEHVDNQEAYKQFKSNIKNFEYTIGLVDSDQLKVYVFKL